MSKHAANRFEQGEYANKRTTEKWIRRLVMLIIQRTNVVVINEFL